MASSKTQQELRRLDRQILALLNRRMALFQRAADAEARHDLDCSRLLQQVSPLDLLCRHNTGPVTTDNVRAIFREINAGAVASRQTTTIAFMGLWGTYTHQAAMEKFGASSRFLPCPTVADVFEAVARQQASHGVVPVENSTEGAVTHTLDMFVDTNLKICAEIHMPIHHHLLCRCAKNSLRHVYSHPQAFGQCRNWLRKNLPNIPLIEVASTTEAAARCAGEDFSGAIAGSLAAEHYGVPVSEANIEDVTGNTTRFLVLGDESPPPSGDDKTSIMYVVRDRVGALFDSLQPFGRNGINLSFIESRPSRRRSWEYNFFVDFSGHASDANVRRTLDELAEHCQVLKILGSYPRGDQS